MNPLIRIQPTNDGGRRSLTDECKATVAAWLEMMDKRAQKQYENTVDAVKGWQKDRQLDSTSSLLQRIATIRHLISQIDCAFDADAFAEAWLWATEVMYGTAVDPVRGGSPGDDIGDRTGTP